MAGGNNSFPIPLTFQSEEQYSAYGANLCNSYPGVDLNQGLNHLCWQQFSMEQQNHASSMSSSSSPSSSRPITPTEASTSSTPDPVEQSKKGKKGKYDTWAQAEQ